MIKLSLTALLILICSVSFADELGLTNGYVVENIQLIDESNGIVRYKGMDIVISLTSNQILARQLKVYDPSKPARFVLCDKKTYEDFYRDNKLKSDTAFQMKVSTVHGETITGDLYQDTDSVVVLKANYGLITIIKDLIIDPMYLKNKSLQIKNIFTVTLLTGESFDGEQVSSTDSSATYLTDIGDITVLKKNIKNIKNIRSPSLNNRTFLLGNTFTVTMVNRKSFDGVLLSSTDSSETYRADIGVVTVLKRDIMKSIMTVCSAPLDSKFLLFGGSFKVMMLNGESFDGTLISSTDSTVTYQTAIDSVIVLKRNIMIVLNTSLENVFNKSVYASAVALINKESFHGKLTYLSDSTATYWTNIGVVTIHKRNIIAVARTLEDLVYQIKDDNIILPSLYSIYGGAAIPTGDFAGTSALVGGAQTGFTAGFQFVTGGRIGLLLDINFSFNSMNKDVMKNVLKDNLQHQYGYNISLNNVSASNWTNILFLAGLKIGTKNPNGINYFIAPIIGLDLSITPQISGDVSGSYYSANPRGIVINTVAGSVTQASAINKAFMYGATAEIILNCFTVSARYILGTLNYDLTYSDNSSVSIKQNISIFQFCVGYVF